MALKVGDVVQNKSVSDVFGIVAGITVRFIFANYPNLIHHENNYLDLESASQHWKRV